MGGGEEMKKLLLVVALVACVMAWVVPAQALPVTLGFYNITNNNLGDVAIGKAQLSVDIEAVGSDQASFYFRNVGLNSSSICDVYFDDGSLLSIASIVNGGGVSFSEGATPSNLPGWKNAIPDFETTTGFSADSDSGSPGVETNGVNPGEYVGIIFNLQSTKDFDNVLADLENQDLRIGIHVQGFASGGSESFINIPYGGSIPPIEIIPEPATMLLVGSGLVGLARIVRRKK
jgi:hypothetical protein